jgi:hypothetical protein
MRTGDHLTMRPAAIWPLIWWRRRVSTWSIAAATVTSRAVSAASASVPLKPSGNSSSMKRVDRLPLRQRSLAMTAARNAMLCWMPSMTNVSSASAIRSMAASRVAAWVHSLAIIGS